ncbi:MAG: type IV pilus modification PilV family protein [Nitrospiraceae bacterium]
MNKRNDTLRQLSVRSGQGGMTLLAVMLTIFMLTLLGMTSLNLASQEIVSASSVQQEKIAQHLAEGVADTVIQWFHDPNSVPSGLPAELLQKHYELPEHGWSFFDAKGVSQFTGTSDQPDVFYDAARPTDDLLLNNPSTGWFRSLQGLGRILKLKVYGPTRPGLLCTIEATASPSRGGSSISRTMSLQLGAQVIPPLRTGVQAAGTGVNSLGDAWLPVWVHWADFKIGGNVHFSKSEEVPTKSSLASVTGQSYAEMTHREDRWFDLWSGGTVSFAQPTSSGVTTLPLNLHSHQDPSPGLRMDLWNYESLKRAALMYGSYYAIDREGFLYPNGFVESGHGIAAEEVFASKGVGDHHGLVFVDTLDQQPPRSDNLGTVLVGTDYAEGVFVINAHVALKPKGSGQSIPGLSPPSEGLSSVAGRIPVQLSGIHLQGVLYTTGNLTFEGQAKVFGAVVTEGTLTAGHALASALEVWYNHDLASGLVRGIPLVYVAPGTRQIHY